MKTFFSSVSSNLKYAFKPSITWTAKSSSARRGSISLISGWGEASDRSKSGVDSQSGVSYARTA